MCAVALQIFAFSITTCLFAKAQRIKHQKKTERVSTSDDPTIKIPKPSFPDYKLP